MNKNVIIIVLLVIVGIYSWNSASFQNTANALEIFNSIVFVFTIIFSMMFLAAEIKE